MSFKYYCNSCLYGSDNKSNYNKHIKSEKHLKKVRDNDKNPELFRTPLCSQTTKCKYCNSSFTRVSNLSRHLKICKEKFTSDQKELELEKEKEKVKNLEMQLKIKDAQIEILKETNKIKSNTYISVKNYVQQNYSDAPPLLKKDDYAELDFQEGLIDKLAYYHKNRILTKYLGDLLINWYKKDDPSQQSIWNSDVTRLTYVIKELMSNNKSYWNQDQKGIKTQEYIIEPLLEYIKHIIVKYLKRVQLLIKNASVEELTNLMENSSILTQIKKDIDNKELSDELIKYLAPYFSIEKNLLKN